MRIHGGITRRAAVVLAGLLSAMLATTVHAAPAGAAERVVPDRGGSSDTRIADGSISYGEISRMRVRNERHRLVVRVESTPRSGGADYWNVWVDTRRGRPGPERLIQFYAPFRSAIAYRADGFTMEPRGRDQVCRQLPRRLQTSGGTKNSTLTLMIPRRCLGRVSGPLRVTAATAMEYGVADWAPGFRAWSKPIRRG